MLKGKVDSKSWSLNLDQIAILMFTEKLLL